MLAILQSILVYGIMVWIMTYNAKIVLSRNFAPRTFVQFITNKNILVPLIIFSILASIRWQVGVDCTSYIHSFYNELSDRQLEKGETLFYAIRDFFKTLNLSHVPYFFTLAFLQMLFTYYGLRKRADIMLFFPLMFVLYGTYWSYMNGVRQSIACSIFIFTTLLLSEKKIIKAAIWILIAALFHRSAYILFILAGIFYLTRKYFLNRYIQLSILFICYIMMGMSVGDQLASIATYVLDFAGYEEGSQEHLLETIFDINFGFRAYLMLFANVIIILSSNKLKKFYNSEHFNLMYNIYFVGICAWVLFYGNHGIERIVMYLDCFIPIILSCGAYYFYKNRSILICRIRLCLIIIFLLSRTFYDMYKSTSDEIDYTNYKTIFFIKEFNIK